MFIILKFCFVYYKSLKFYVVINEEKYRTTRGKCSLVVVLTCVHAYGTSYERDCMRPVNVDDNGDLEKIALN